LDKFHFFIFVSCSIHFFRFHSFQANDIFNMLPIYLLTSLLAGVQASLTYKGVDWSSLLIEEAAGYTYKTTAGTVEPLETILKASGVNTVRQRLWVNPSTGYYNLAYNLKLAARAKAAGLNVYLDMHFSDTWADPGHQVLLSQFNGMVFGSGRSVANLLLKTDRALRVANRHNRRPNLGTLQLHPRRI
jgi:arabinogalactan endo-1,4-beta-galactosidase